MYGTAYQHPKCSQSSSSHPTRIPAPPRKEKYLSHSDSALVCRTVPHPKPDDMTLSSLSCSVSSKTSSKAQNVSDKNTSDKNGDDILQWINSLTRSSSLPPTNANCLSYTMEPNPPETEVQSWDL